MTRSPVKQRAAPPRPSLLVGSHLQDCVDAFEKLKERIENIRQQPGFTEHSRARWHALVPSCRSLRETLTSLGENSTLFACQVYETCSDVCVTAEDYPELLKGLQHLIHTIYPTLRASGHKGVTRYSDAAAALIAYFGLIPRASALDLVCTLRSLPIEILRSERVHVALSTIKMIREGNYAALFKTYDTLDDFTLLKQLLKSRLQLEREKGLLVMGTAYRQMKLREAERLLYCEHGEVSPLSYCRSANPQNMGNNHMSTTAIITLLKGLADGGHTTAAYALGELQMAREPELLIFKS